MYKQTPLPDLTQPAKSPEKSNVLIKQQHADPIRRQSHSMGNMTTTETITSTDVPHQSIPLKEANQDVSSSYLKQGRILGQLLIILVVLVLLVNVPISYRGGGLAQVVPESKSTIIREGMILRGGGPDVYVLDNYQLRRFNTQETFDYFDNRYHLSGRIQTVDDDLLTQFGQGPPIRYLARCRDLPGIYILEKGQKYLLERMSPISPASRWDRVNLISCHILRSLPDGPPISEKVE